jgi:hypothetical protein
LPVEEIAAAIPATPTKGRAGKSRVRIPKHSGTRKVAAKSKAKPRDERDDFDVDALIAPLLSEIAAKRKAAAKPEPEQTPAPEPVMVIPPPTEDVDPMFFADDAMIVPPPTPAQAERSAWLELVESLRSDIERLKTEKEGGTSPPSSPPPVVEQPTPVAARSMSKVRKPAAPVVQMPPAAARVSRTKVRKPVQDQWGLFDPEQCGFAALLAKLDEISAREEASA